MYIWILRCIHTQLQPYLCTLCCNIYAKSMLIPFLHAKWCEREIPLGSSSALWHHFHRRKIKKKKKKMWKSVPQMLIDALVYVVVIMKKLRWVNETANMGTIKRSQIQGCIHANISILKSFLSIYKSWVLRCILIN